MKKKQPGLRLLYKKNLMEDFVWATNEEAVEYLKEGYRFIEKPKRGKCPCGGYYQDWHSHASDCIELGGSKVYAS